MRDASHMLSIALLQYNVTFPCCASFMVHRDRVLRNPRALYEILFDAAYWYKPVSTRCLVRLVMSGFRAWFS